MCSHVITKIGKFMLVILVQRVTNLEIKINDINHSVINLGIQIVKMLHSTYCGYNGTKPRTKYWENMISDEDFST